MYYTDHKLILMFLQKFCLLQLIFLLLFEMKQGWKNLYAEIAKAQSVNYTKDRKSVVMASTYRNIDFDSRRGAICIGNVADVDLQGAQHRL